jgi:hypothetical protein
MQRDSACLQSADRFSLGKMSLQDVDGRDLSRPGIALPNRGFDGGFPKISSFSVVDRV